MRIDLRRALSAVLILTIAALWIYAAAHSNWSNNERIEAEGRP